MSELTDNVVRDGDQYRCLKDGAPMVLVPEGEFIMGSAPDDLFAAEDEKPQRRALLSAYLIDVYPVTNDRYARFVNAGGYRERAFWTTDGWAWREAKGIDRPLMWKLDTSDWRGPEQPVAGVNWYEASAYARWAGKQLPSEAQWERAARGVDGRRFPWGDEFPSPMRCNYDNVVGRTTPVGAYPRGVSPCGCHDMAGNVNNWCLDWHWPPFYRYCQEHGLNRDPVLDDEWVAKIGAPVGEKSDRGGGYATSQTLWEVLGCTAKTHWPPADRYPWNGFRTVIRLA